jgi:membrane-associated phospholipid phosphatase
VTAATISFHFRRLAAALHSTDKILLAFWSLLALVSLIFYSRIPQWPVLIAADLTAVLLVCSLAYASLRTRSTAVRWVHDWNAFPLVIFTYKHLYPMISPLHKGKDYDWLLIAADRWLFQANPTQWLVRFSHPFLTEALEIAYSLFFVFFIVVGVELYRRPDLSQFRYFRFTVVYGFFISYMGYFFLPAVGPRFTLHDFTRLPAELPGLFFTPALRWFINLCESIPSGATNSIALACAQRDVFPSGHTMMTLLVLILAYRFQLMTRHGLLVVGALLIFGTVYLRYHYFIDILAGAVLAIPCLFTSRKFFAFMSGTG